MAVLLVADIGNSNLVLGVFDGTRLVGSWRLTSRPIRTADEYAVLVAGILQRGGIESTSLHDAMVASVVPQLDRPIGQALQALVGQPPHFVGPGIKTGISIRYDRPQDVGADRIVNAVAALESAQRACIIVDFGTATTVDAVAADGRYLGGAIAPGIEVSLEALSGSTAKLPKVDLARPRTTIGQNTAQSIQAGVYFGYLGLVEGLVQRVRSELASATDGEIRVIATGGVSETLSADLPIIDEVDTNLTLRGLQLLYARNQRS